MRLTLALISLLIILAIVWDGIRRNRQLRQAQKRQRDQALEQADKHLQEKRRKQSAPKPADDEAEAVQLSLFDDQPEFPPEEPVVSEAPAISQTVESTDVQTVEPSPAAEPEALSEAAPISPPEPPTLISLFILAKKPAVFHGTKILQALLKLGCRYGEHNIFHRHVRLDGKGPIYFSVASAINPGTFDLHQMQHFTTPGLTLFMAVDRDNNPQMRVDLLLDSAQQLTAALDGELCDDKRQVITSERLLGYQQLFAEQAPEPVLTLER